MKIIPFIVLFLAGLTFSRAEDFVLEEIRIQVTPIEDTEYYLAVQLKGDSKQTEFYTVDKPLKGNQQEARIPLRLDDIRKGIWVDIIVHLSKDKETAATYKANERTTARIQVLREMDDKKTFIPFQNINRSLIYDVKYRIE